MGLQSRNYIDPIDESMTGLLEVKHTSKQIKVYTHTHI